MNRMSWPYKYRLAHRLSENYFSLHNFAFLFFNEARNTVKIPVTVDVSQFIERACVSQRVMPFLIDSP